MITNNRASLVSINCFVPVAVCPSFKKWSQWLSLGFVNLPKIDALLEMT